MPSYIFLVVVVALVVVFTVVLTVVFTVVAFVSNALSDKISALNLPMYGGTVVAGDIYLVVTAGVVTAACVSSGVSSYT